MQGSMAYQLFWREVSVMGADHLHKVAGGGSMMSEPCGAILTHNGDSCRAS